MSNLPVCIIKENAEALLITRDRLFPNRSKLGPINGILDAELSVSCLQQKRKIKMYKVEF